MFRLIPGVFYSSTKNRSNTRNRNQQTSPPPCTTLHSTTLHYTTPHYTSGHCTTLHYTTLQGTTLHNRTLHYTTQQDTALHYTPCTTLHYRATHCMTLHHTATISCGVTCGHLMHVGLLLYSLPHIQSNCSVMVVLKNKGGKDTYKVVYIRGNDRSRYKAKWTKDSKMKYQAAIVLDDIPKDRCLYK